MKPAFVVTAILLFPMMVLAQTSVTIAPQSQPPGPQASTTAPAFPFPGGFNPPAGLFDNFWNDPALAAELHLSDIQRKQLQDASLKQQLALIDGGADGLKALARMSALLEADQFDDAAYKLQLNNLATAAGKFVQDIGELAITPRRVLTLEQWRRLQSLQRAKRAAVAPRPQTTHTPPPGRP